MKFAIALLLWLNLLPLYHLKMTDYQHKKHELIVVFKKEISQAVAEDFLNSFKLIYRKGMDSSKGKNYFYSTGPKFIVVFKKESDKNRFMKAAENHKKEIFELYQPNWKITKD